MLNGSNLADEVQHEDLINQLEIENAQLKHDLKLALSRPVFRLDRPEEGTKLVLLTTGGICTVGMVAPDVQEWAHLPMRRETWLRKRQYKGVL